MKTISRIAYSNDKRNRTRSILIMMAICLTTMLLVIISTVGNGVIHLQKSQAASSYGSNYGLFIAADGTQLKEVERRAEISDIGIMCTEGILKGNENGGFVSADETVRKMLPYNQEYVLKEGTYPEKAQEIAAGRAFFDAVGYHDVKVGDTVTLEYRSGMQSEYAPVEFTVSGILYDRDEYTIEASYVVFGSQDFYNERVAEGDRQYNIYFTLSDSANVSMNNVAPVIKEIADSCGIDQKNVIINDLYLQWVLQPSYEMIVVCGTLILGIVLFSVVVIYNIFQVGIAQKVQEYGKIKALGATRKQMKQLIFREGILLAVPSIPLGLLFGFLIAKVSFNWLVEQGNLVSSGIKNHQVPLFSLTIMLICIFVSFLTVVLALRKPMKIVSRISPIEATRYLDGSKTQKQGRRKGRKDVTVFSMAMANVTGNPKRTIATILTMGLSCVLFVIISNYVGNIDTEHEARIAINHGQFELQLDYSQNYDEAYPENNLDTILQNNPLNDSLIKEIKSIPGVTDVLTREIVSADLNGTKFPVAIVNQEDFEMMRGDGDIGSMDYAQAVKNGDVFFGAYAMPGILVVEDDENLNRGITFSLKKSGYEVFSAESVKKAKRIASDHNVDVTICDVNLPDGNGLEFVRWMRCNYNTYIICLTALDQEMDQVMGYEAGADDYITKPFSLSVLLLKIEAHFRRRQEKTEAGKMISGDIVFIAGEMKVLIKSREISLTKTELKMLTFFLQNPKQILSKTQILENVFDLEGDFVDENTIAVNIRRLREKIEDNPAAPVYIKNIRGLGYIWNQEVRQ